MTSLKVISLMLLISCTRQILAKNQGYQWTKEKFPNPRVDPAPFCNLPKEPSFVCDADSQFDHRQSKMLYLINF
jgi:hypothetical protein